MELSLGFFYAKLKASIPDASMQNRTPNGAFSAVEILDAFDPIRYRNTLYVDVSPGKPLQVPEGSSVVTCAARLHLFPDCNTISVPGKDDIIEAYKVLSRELCRCLAWAEKVNQAIAMHADLQKIIDITEEVVSNPMYIADSSFKMLAMVGHEINEISAIWKYQQQYGYLPYHVMQTLIDTGELALFNNSLHAFRVESQAFTNPFITKSIRRNNEHYGYFFIIELYSELQECDLEIAEYLGQLLSSAMFYEKSYFEISGFYHEHFFVDIIEGKLTDKDLINNQLKPLNWENEGDYALFHINTKDDNDAIRHHMIALSMGDMEAQCLIYKDCILGILNDYSSRIDHIKAHLNSLSRSFNRRVVLSDEFTRFNELGRYYDQTAFALAYLEDNATPMRLVTYDELYLHHIDSLIGDSIPRAKLAELLIAHDAEHGTEYCRTLYCWIVCDKNTVKAAKRLFIHRNTLIYRLEKINEISELRTESVGDQIRLILSLHDHCATLDG